DEIIVTGKFKPWKNILQISANTIDHLDSASNLPITPIYNQSASKGIKTIITMRAIMELISRLGEIVLPVYLQNIQSKTTTEQKTYADLIKAIHLPNSLQEREEALQHLAFYELVEMQIVIQSRKQEQQRTQNVGIAHKKYSDK